MNATMAMSKCARMLEAITMCHSDFAYAKTRDPPLYDMPIAGANIQHTYSFPSLSFLLLFPFFSHRVKIMARRQAPDDSHSSRSRISVASLSSFIESDARTADGSQPISAFTRLWFLLLVASLLLVHHASVFSPPAVAAHFLSSVSNRTTPSVSPELEHQPVNIAYFIQIAESTIHHLPRLLRAVHHPQNVYAIHFDLKIPPTLMNATITSIREHPRYTHNVHVMKSELITYRGISMLLNTINAMRFLLDTHPTWQYFINLSGADYPLLTSQTHRTLLSHTLNLNFFTFAPRHKWLPMAKTRMSQLWFDESLTFQTNATLARLKKLEVHNPLIDTVCFDISHAEAWMIVSREFSDFVIHADMSRKMLLTFSHTADSSEHFFASLAWNHPKFKNSIVPHSLRMIIWVHDGTPSGQHPYFIDDKQPDGQYKFKEMVGDSVLFFARKFETPDSKLMDFIDQRALRAKVVRDASIHFEKKINSRALRLEQL